MMSSLASIAIVTVILSLPLAKSFLLPNERWKNGGTADTIILNSNARLLSPLLTSAPPLKALFSIPSIDGDYDVKIGGRGMTEHVILLHDSLKKLTGRGLCERMGISESVMQSKSGIYNDICLNNRFVLISHGTQDDPIFNFGNMAGLEAFVRTWDEFTTIPSRKSVVLQSIDEELRIELMEKVTNDGYVEGASGIRVRGDGKFMRLVDAVVWNCYDIDGTYSGQAALFDREKCPVMSSIDER